MGVFHKIDSIADARKAEKQEADRLAAASIAFVTLAEKGEIDDTTASEHPAQFIPWNGESTYKPNQLRVFGGVLYRCLQAHTGKSDLDPKKSPALWQPLGDPALEYPVWSQPICAVDVYNLNDKVSHKGKRWVSVVPLNGWEPGVFGWREITDKEGGDK